MEGRRARNFYRIEWKDAHPLAENYLWTILSNKELKAQALSVTHRKPTTGHWKRFAAMVAKLGVFNKFIDIALSQAFWTFVYATSAMDITGSTITAQQNATLIIMYLHTVRMVFAKLLEDRRQGVLTLDFMTKMAATTSEADMEKFVKEVSVNQISYQTQL